MHDDSSFLPLGAAAHVGAPGTHQADALFDLEELGAHPFSTGVPDPVVDEIAAALRRADPRGERFAAVFRATFDQLYDGQHTGRYCWDQLYKTEKTHFGTLIEINLRREFGDVLHDGELLDYKVRGHDVDCKFSQRSGGWMLPPEAIGHVILACTASDQAGTWSVGVVRARPETCRLSVNRDGKTALTPAGVAGIVWLHQDAELPPNVLLRVDPAVVTGIFAFPTGQQRVNELFRRVTNRRIGRNTVATVAEQDDYMKRVRANGGARSTLQAEGIVITGGDYVAHRAIARALGAEVPQPGEFVSIRVVPALPTDAAPTAEIEGSLWRQARTGEAAVTAAPTLPAARRDVAAARLDDLLIPLL
ncbi:NaeI family type II restriction endonuclease [Hoyosella sp. YIM 151337]|uniref:NaeI family type II restriction endonuclease n=1 Tax=Hoyosella sp. YIM 151337 TaxID=2992742 RepID=UPI0022359846|nr:NaeI family type II restriction endonuclease [Hoyosella sp. YIM 151337]MCW4352183.1 NaeI family type II restriction endonuclease [Hoyosella sp. YIM 151337]